MLSTETREKEQINDGKLYGNGDFCVHLQKNFMEPKIGTRMKVSPDLTGLSRWEEGDVIDLEHNPFKGLVIAIKDNDNRIYFGESKYFIPV